MDAILRAGSPQHREPADRIMRGSRLLVLLGVLAAVYGLAMGLFAVRNGGVDGLLQLVSSTIKLPLLFLLTVAITFPSLYVFCSLVDSWLGPRRVTKYVLLATSVIAAVAASLAPILAFFTVSTTSYPFMVLLNVALLSVAGLTGCAYLVRALRHQERVEYADGVEGPPEYASASGPIDPAKRVLLIWIVLFGVVGTQMGWVLRPFIGAPGTPFVVFRETKGSVVQGVFGSLGRLVVPSDEEEPSRGR
ncbi:MAG: hypothetical protein AAGI17_02245 [Planctomycetota bacterium]